MSKKKRKIPQHTDLNIHDIAKLRNIKLTKRNLLGIRAGIFDPLGIAVPFTIKLNIGMKQLFDIEENLAWDDAIPDKFVDWWIEIMT